MKKLKERRGFGLRTILAIVLVLAIGAGAAVFVLSRNRDGVTINSDLIGERLKYIGDLVSLEYYYKNVSSLEKEKFNVLGVSIPFTAGRAILSYEGVLKYGITVGDVDIDVSGGRVTLTIPESRVISHEMPEDNIEIFDSGRNVFNPVTIADYVSFAGEQKEKVMEEAEELCEAESKDDVIWEAADLLYFVNVLMYKEGVTWKDVYDELDKRHKA